MILQFLSKLFKKKRNEPLHTSGEGSDNAETKETKKIISNPQKSKTMKKAKPNLPASSMLKAPAAAAAKVVKKAAAKKVVKAVMKKAAKKKY
jgi:CO dehydrogenase/acetyl-CoA synthase beta subunit